MNVTLPDRLFQIAMTILPVSNNGLVKPAPTKKGSLRLVSTEQANVFRRSAVFLLKQQMVSGWKDGWKFPLKRPIGLAYTVFLPSIDSDLSNVIKAFEDAATHAGIWDDDRQVDTFVMHRYLESERLPGQPKLEVAMWECTHSAVENALLSAKRKRPGPRRKTLRGLATPNIRRAPVK